MTTNMTTWNERLREALTSRDVTASDLARRTGVTPPAVKKWLDGLTTKPKYDDVMSICRALNITPEWLMSGTGILHSESDANLLEIDQLDLVASCGSGATNFNAEVKQMAVSRDWFKRNFMYHAPSSIKVITARGDSMSPDIEDGDTVFLDTSDTASLHDGIYAIMVDGELYIKRVQKIPGKKIVLISANPAYKDIEVPLGGDLEVIVLGRVVKTMKMRTY